MSNVQTGFRLIPGSQLVIEWIGGEEWERTPPLVAPTAAEVSRGDGVPLSEIESWSWGAANND